MGLSIEIKSIKKSFSSGLMTKRVDAVVDISLEVEEGEIFGFLGPNGAGKTTTIKALLGLIRVDGGLIRVLGQPTSELSWRSRIGYMPENPNFYEHLTGFELVTFFGRLGGLSRHEAEQQAKRNLERVGLAHAMGQRLRKYSKGMVQRAGLAQALTGTPELLILDEPMTGLDPIGRRDIRELILSLRDEGRTIFYSTHILPDVEMTCDRVSIIHRGRTRRTGTLDEILTQTTRGVSVRLGVSGDQADAIKREHPHVVLRGVEASLELDGVDAAQRFVAEMVGAGATLLEFTPHRDDLETIFMRSLTEGEVAA